MEQSTPHESATGLSIQVPPEVIKVREFETYVRWRSLPSFLRHPPKEKNGRVPTPREFAESMGIEDDIALELIELQTKTAFGERFNIDRNTLASWDRKIYARDILPDLREWAYELNRNVLFSLYNKTIRGGLPEHYALWFKLSANWSDKLKIDLTKREVKKITVHVLPAPVPHE